ncbi:hypothetical protein TW85_02455 [Marinomonas sp. S3726]|uniref:hypothetical protein n=1 Tax=Marinomonas sp. S3726 TaxID=579484 RepID=UPI0005FA1A79|nr:hypothetical protein [Marinomonas sp. S3726]KJZ15779.1 hypothetical protein TW85_02455 [Marinomonas sp. S3726]
MIDTYKIVSRGRFLFFFVALVVLGAWVINKAYQKHFNSINISVEEQAELGISLLEFPRNMMPIEGLVAEKWASFYVQPSQCDTLCVRTLAQLEQIKLEASGSEEAKEQTQAGLAIQIITKDMKGYSDYWSLIRSEGYANHFDRILMVNKSGQFAGSIVAPYDLKHWQALDKRLNQ